ncbi:MAG: hypothetical protein ABI352_08560 [Candidatus Dormibacter sp.]
MRCPAFATRVLCLGAASLPVVAAFTVVGVASRVGLVSSGCAQASSVHHAALVVEHSSGGVVKICVAFTEAQITGEQLLHRSGVEYNTQPFGGNGDAVCQIDNEPAGYSSCFQDGKFWAMFVSRSDGAWAFASQGVANQTFGDGDAEGFRYQSQSDSSPPAASPAGVCPRPVPATPVPVSTSRAASARPGPSAAATSHPTSSTAATSLPAAATRDATVSAPSSPSPGGTTPAAVAQAKAGGAPPASPGSATAGVWIAFALGASLIALLAAQLARQRRTRPGR